ncbi:MAG: oligosaccharide flippase family protein [Bacteroidetes bacterium]|nr:oligosaccharide flippase family protein [Bacteroidota bacterium]
MGITEFSYWQLFLFYVGYSGFFHFGLNDGLYLRYGGVSYEQLDHGLIGSQLWVSMAAQFVFCTGIFIYARLGVADNLRSFVLMATAVYILLYNTIIFFGYLFQATNKIVNFSLSVVLDKIFFIASIILLLGVRVKHFQPFVLLYLLSKSIALIYCLYTGRRIAFAKLLSFKTTVKSIYSNVSVGIKLMISNIASGLILGVGRFMIDRSWGINAFGKLSFALSLTGFFLIFIYQVSIVLFPMLRQVTPDQQKRFYLVSRDFLGILLSSVFIFYLPINYLLTLWLPKYKDSLNYLIILLPLCTFDGKLEMLCSTYLKVMRKEKLLLMINLFSLIVSVVLCSISAFIFRNIYAVVVSMTLAVAIRSFIAERYIAKIMQASILKYQVLENILAIVFVISTWFLQPLLGFVVFACFYVIYLTIMRHELVSVFNTAKFYMKRRTLSATTIGTSLNE